MSTKTAVVIGATGNVGKAVCKTLQEANFNVDPQWLDENRPDVTQTNAYQHLPKKIDTAIYLAGINRVKKFEEVTEDDWDTVLNVNLKGAFLFAKAALPAMKAAKNASFIVISSIMVTHPYPGRFVYAVSKGGLEAMVRSLAIEWGEYGIATHALRLGHIDGLMKTTTVNPKLLPAAKQFSPLHRLISPEEVASYILWLATGGCHSLTGSIIDFDPGYMINRWPLLSTETSP